MVQEPNKNLELVRKFKRKLEKNIRVEKLVLFGSRAKGTFSRYSDFDLLIVSNNFKGVPWYKRPAKLYLRWNEDYPLELLCYTPKEVMERVGKSGVVSEAMNTGVEI